MINGKQLNTKTKDGIFCLAKLYGACKGNILIHLYSIKLRIIKNNKKVKQFSIGVDGVKVLNLDTAIVILELVLV